MASAAQVPNVPAQSLDNHTRWDPLFHFTSIPIMVLTVLASIWHDYKHPGLWNTWIILVAIGGAIAVFNSRLKTLKVQDRVIRLEERIRLAELCGPEFRPRIAQLTERQLVALRFASDAELPALAAKTVDGKLEPKEIKKMVKEWRADWWRA